MSQTSVIPNAQSVSLSPRVMAQAGVPFNDALWFTRIPGGRAKVEAMATPTGRKVLERVSAFLKQSPAPMPAPA